MTQKIDGMSRQLTMRGRSAARVAQVCRSATSHVMNSAQAKTILASLLVAAALNCHAQVYSVHVYAFGRVYDHQWLIGSPSNYYGFTQYREYQDANGRVLMTSEQHRTVRMPTYTRIHLGSSGFTLRMPLWLVGTVAIVGLTSLCLLPFVLGGRIRRLRGDEAKNAKP